MKFLSLIFILLFSVSSVFAKEPENLQVLIQQLIHYHDSKEYDQDIKQVIDQASDYLHHRLESPTDKNKPLAMILDIDETSLSNYPDLYKMHFGGSFREVQDLEGKGTDPLISPTLALYNYAKANKVAVFFVTGRTERYKEATAKNLERAGYKNWDGLYLKPENYNLNSASFYKANIRKEIENQGFDIVLNIGDQESDLVGGYADKTFKLPNPYYFVP